MLCCPPDLHREEPRAEGRRRPPALLREPVFLLLLGAGLVYLLLGDFTEAGLLLGFAAVFAVAVLLVGRKAPPLKE